MGKQVYDAVHNSKGNLRDDINMQFLNFKYGDKRISDFNLIATIENNSIDRELYAPFSDTTSKYSGIDGQAYWYSTFEPAQLNFTLATDGMTEEELNNFKSWFRPGPAKELVLSEHHNRIAYARVAAPPTMAMLPFDSGARLADEVGLRNLTTDVIPMTLYKGTIKLTFILDDPFWHANTSILKKVQSTKDKKYYLTYYNQGKSDWDNDWCSDEHTKRALKIIKEDNIPHVAGFRNHISYTTTSGDKGEHLNILLPHKSVLDTYKEKQSDETYDTGAYKSFRQVKGDHLNPQLPEELKKDSQNQADFKNQAPLKKSGYYFIYNSGNVDSHATLNTYIKVRRNESGYYGYAEDGEKPTDITSDATISIIAHEDSKNPHDTMTFKFGLPDFLYSYNVAMQKISELNDLKYAVELKDFFVDQLTSPETRQWFIHELNACQINPTRLGENTTLFDHFKTIWAGSGNGDVYFTMRVNSKTGEAIMVLDKTNSSLYNDKEYPFMGKFPSEKNCGNMIKSRYLYVPGNMSDHYPSSIELHGATFLALTISYEYTYL